MAAVDNPYQALIGDAVRNGHDVSKSPLQDVIHKPMGAKTAAVNERLGEKAMSPAGVESEAPVSGIPEYPITLQHKPPVDLDKDIPRPGMPRANKAVSREKPDGDPRTPNNRTVLQQHVMFWDRDNDGIIWPIDTFVGFRRLGFNLLISAVAVPFIHMSFSYPTLKSWIPDPRLPIYLDQIHRTKHGSDSEVFDTEGRFVPEKFESIFSKFDRENKGGLGWKDIQEMVYSNMNVNDPNGWIAERLEWWITYLLLRDTHTGLLSKEKIRAVYDGTIFETVAKEVEARKNRKTMYKTE